MEAFWTRFNPSIVEVLRLIKNGGIGEMNYLNADFSVFFMNVPDFSRILNMDLAGGSLLDVGVYPIFLAYSIFGMQKEILATSRFYPTGVDIQTSAILKSDNGIANIMSGFISQSDMVARICGARGMILIDAIWHETQGFTTVIDGITRKYSYPAKGKGFTYEIEKCKKCISENLMESPNWSHQNSLDLITITDEIRKQVGLKYPFEK